MYTVTDKNILRLFWGDRDAYPSSVTASKQLWKLWYRQQQMENTMTNAIDADTIKVPAFDDKTINALMAKATDLPVDAEDENDVFIQTDEDYDGTATIH